jgi:hypothetical protein
MDGLGREILSVRNNCKEVAASKQDVAVRAWLLDDSRHDGKDDWVQVAQ